jgi:alanyl aminopeptidase
MRKALIVALALAACGRSASKKQPEDKRDEAAVTPPSLRLPDDAAPTAYRASLALDPAQATFGGHVEIAIDVKRPTKHLWLNAQDLTFEKAVLRRGGEEIVLATKAEPRNFVALDGDFAPGPATLVIDYRGKQELTWSHGMRKREDRGDAYLVTQFEPDGARRVFPCFDEPDWKTPWQLTLEVPAALTAISNTRQTAE